MHVRVYTCMTCVNNSNVYKNWTKNTGEGWLTFLTVHITVFKFYILNKLFYCLKLSYFANYMHTYLSFQKKIQIIMKKKVQRTCKFTFQGLVVTILSDPNNCQLFSNNNISIAFIQIICLQKNLLEMEIKQFHSFLHLTCVLGP